MMGMTVLLVGWLQHEPSDAFSQHGKGLLQPWVPPAAWRVREGVDELGEG